MYVSLILCCRNKQDQWSLRGQTIGIILDISLSSGGSLNTLVEAMLNALSLFTYLRFPPHLRRMLCTTNWIEQFNRSFKLTLHMRAEMPSPESVLFLLGSVALQITTETYLHRLYQLVDWHIK